MLHNVYLVIALHLHVFNAPSVSL